MQQRDQPVEQRRLARQYFPARLRQSEPLRAVDFWKRLHASAAWRPFHFERIAAELLDVECAFAYVDEETAVRGLNSSGVAVRAMENSSEEAVSTAHRKAIAPFRKEDGGYRINATFRCLVATPG